MNSASSASAAPRCKAAAVETSFTTFLELSLQAAEPERKWQVVNCGGVSYASYRLVPILEEVLHHEPDLIVVYTGQNEFLEDRAYRHVKRIPEVVARPAEILASTRTWQVLHRMWQPDHSDHHGKAEPTVPGRPVLPDEVDAMLEYRDGLERYHRDEKWRRDIEAHFKFNIRRMVALAREADVPFLLVNPVCNLRDCPPFKNQHRDGLTEEQLERWERLVSAAGEHSAKNRHEAYRAQLDSLDSLYFARGQQRLDILRCWTQGKAGTEWSYQDEEPVFIADPKSAALPNAGTEGP